IKAWTPVEISWFSFITKKTVRWVMQQMIDAGLGSMPGGGAEIFDPEVRKQLCEHKADCTVWFDVHRTAHELGLKSNATMLYGHIEQAAHRIDHLLQLRDLQDETGGFQTFIPLAFHPDNTELKSINKADGLVDLRTIAIARLMLDNFDHIKAYWIMLGQETAQLALSYGADDIDGTVVHELIYHDAGAETPEGMTVEQLHQLIREAGREPVERDTLYRRVIRVGADWKVGESVMA
ncbi:MAG: CofH family radical SAM protein, partial [Fuerstiella sp.]|nr:CofH family radical SAM protein [Fuerstiella sp.]